MIRYVLVDGKRTLNEESIRKSLAYKGQVVMFKSRNAAGRYVAALEELGVETKDLNIVKVSVKLTAQD